MPFRSKAQMRYLYATHPDVAARFASYGVPKNLPARATAYKRGKRKPDSTPGTGGGGYERTPDQSDREQARYRAAQAMGRARAERRATRKTKPRPIRPGYGRAWDDYPTNA